MIIGPLCKESGSRAAGVGSLAVAPHKLAKIKPPCKGLEEYQNNGSYMLSAGDVGYSEVLLTHNMYG